jgi:hypothetical protein
MNGGLVPVLVPLLSERETLQTLALVMRHAEPQRAQATCAASAVAIQEKRLHLLRVDPRPSLDTENGSGRQDAKRGPGVGVRRQTPTAMGTMAVIACTVESKGPTCFESEKKRVGLGTNVRLRAFRRSTDEIGTAARGCETREPLTTWGHLRMHNRREAKTRGRGPGVFLSLHPQDACLWWLGHSRTHVCKQLQRLRECLLLR